MRAAPDDTGTYMLRGMRVRVRAPDPDELMQPRGTESAAAARPNVRTHAPATPRVRPELPDPRATGAWRALFAGNGLRRMLSPHALDALFRNPAVAAALPPAPAHAADGIACDVQVYEANAPQRLRALAESIERDTGVTAPLLQLDDALIARLALPDMLRGHRLPRVLWREPDVVLPGERFASVSVVQAGVAPPHVPHVTPRVPRPVAAAIPARYTRPWEFRVARTEALFAMHTDRTGARAVLRRVLRRFGRRARLGRWRSLLYGRTAQEQLWGVQPPQRGYEDADVVEWARRMLSVAGYDADRWLPEWELFWRRKGV